MPENKLYLPEGLRPPVPLALDHLREALETGDILEAPVQRCGVDHTLLLNLGGVQGNLVFDGNAADVATATGSDNATYYRLREVAKLAAGTKGAFNVTWSQETGVSIVKGTDYTAETAPAGVESAAAVTKLTVTVDGKAVEVNVVNVGGSNYVSAAGLAALLGVSAVEADGVLTVTVPVNTGIGG